jgi:hypothetical protein
MARTIAEDLNEEFPGRRHQRFLRQRFQKGVFGKSDIGFRWSDQHNGFFKNGKFQFLGLDNCIFLFSLFGCGYRTANGARIITIECFGDGIVEGIGLEIVREHRRPGNGLEQNPLSAEDGDQRKRDKYPAETGKHLWTFGRSCRQVKMEVPGQRMGKTMMQSPYRNNYEDDC